MPIREEGAYKVYDNFSLLGGLNTADSPFIVAETQATDGYNWDYTTRGAITKRLGHTPLNTSADAQAQTLGLGLYDSASNRYVMRAAGTKLQNIGNLGTPAVSFTNLTADATGASSTAFSTTAPCTFAMGSTTQSSALWCAGGGTTNLLGIYSGTKFTTNGVPEAPITSTSNFTTATATSGSYNFLPVGYYQYTITLVKASTGAEGNALEEVYETAAEIHVSSTGHVTLTWALTSADTTKYTFLNVYRSAVQASAGLADGFTAGVLLGQVPIATTSIVDYGYDPATGNSWDYTGGGSPLSAYTDTSALIPRAGNLELDQSQLPMQTYGNVVVWNGRLVTCNASNVYISDTEKFEAWPLSNIFSVPSGGPITALGVVGLSSGIAGVGINEALCIFKDREIWVVTSSGAPFDYTTWQLSFLGTAGCPSQRLIVNTDNSILWLNYRGVFSWNGSAKPQYLSQPLEDKFAVGGDINVGALSSGWAQFYQQKKQVLWCVSSNTYGTNNYWLKLDVRLTTMQTNGMLTQAITHGIFSPDQTQNFQPMYAGLCFTVSASPTQEYLYLGDNAGYMYQGYSGAVDGTATAVALQYSTPQMHMGSPTVRKYFSKVVVWVKDVGEPSMAIDYVTDWKALSQASPAATPSTRLSQAPATWDVSLWDQAVWGPAPSTVYPITFYFNSQAGNNAAGATLQLVFTDSSEQYTPTIYGYSVYFTETGAVA